MRLFSHDTKVEALRQAPLFEGLSRKDLVQLTRMTEDMEVAAGKVLCKQGQYGSEFFVIVEGAADVTRDGQQVATLGDGDFFGEIALVERSKRTATVTAKTPLRFFVLTSRSFWQAMEQHPEVERKVLRALAKRVLRTADQSAE